MAENQQKGLMKKAYLEKKVKYIMNVICATLFTTQKRANKRSGKRMERKLKEIHKVIGGFEKVLDVENRYNTGYMDVKKWF